MFLDKDDNIDPEFVRSMTGEEERQRKLAVEEAVRQILRNVGEDPDREGLERTPERIARMYDEILGGYWVDPVALVNEALFDVKYDEMIVVRDIEFYSMCEHHMLPFFGKAHVAYVPRDKVIGLSKIPRIVEMFARRLQVQERMTQQIAELLSQVLDPQGVGVVVEGAHMCSMMRGVRKENARMVTSAMLGNFKDNSKTRNEFMDHLRRPRIEGA
ncbi:MAG: GTP cyclohydrolase I FolE [Chloroflexi bacterium]|jgi:GTP cyclohydrolase I|nr:GTP cyclohydrolase I FolE [Chloroflexota bacterium]